MKNQMKKLSLSQESLRILTTERRYFDTLNMCPNTGPACKPTKIEKAAGD